MPVNYIAARQVLDSAYSHLSKIQLTLHSSEWRSVWDAMDILDVAWLDTHVAERAKA